MYRRTGCWGALGQVRNPHPLEGFGQSNGGSRPFSGCSVPLAARAGYARGRV